MAENRSQKLRGPKGPGGRRGMGPKVKLEHPGQTIKRLLKYIGKSYGVYMVLVLILIIVSVLANVQGTMFTKSLIDDYITPLLHAKEKNFTPLLHKIIQVACIYGVGVFATWAYNRLMVNVTQGTLRKLRDELFVHMESLPIKYFDTHSHGDIMSIYTNDIDTLRQMISQSMTQFFSSLITIISVLAAMLIINVPLTVVTLVMVGVTLIVTKKVAGLSGAYFIQQQRDPVSYTHLTLPTIA